MERALLTESEVSAMTGIAGQTLRHWRHQRREMPFVKMGGAVRYRWSDVDAYLTAQTVGVLA